MEQTLLVQHSSGRNYSSKGFKVVKALQVALLLGLCIWFFNQAKHPHNKYKSEDGNAQNKLSSGEHGATLLGRKGNAGFIVEAMVDFEDGHALGEDEKREELGIRDDELYEDIEEKEGEMKNKVQQMEVQSNGELENSSVGITNQDIKRDETKPETRSKEPMEGNEDRLSAQAKEEDDKEIFVKELYIDYERREENIESENSEAESTINPGEGYMGYIGFHDENGVPPDGIDVVKYSTLFEPRGDDQAGSMHHETAVSSKDRSSFIENAGFSNGEFVDSSQGSERNSTEMPMWL